MEAGKEVKEPKDIGVSPPFESEDDQILKSALADRDSDGLKAQSRNIEDLLSALQIVDNDSKAIAESFYSLFASLRSTLSEATSTSVDHMECFVDAAGKLQENALEAATKGNQYINSCLRLNKEMKGIEKLASQLYPPRIAMIHCQAFIKHTFIYTINYTLVLDSPCSLECCVYQSVVGYIFLSLTNPRKFLRRNVDELDSAVNKLLQLL